MLRFSNENSHETAVENERAIVDIETIKQVNEDLIATIEDTIRIQSEGRRKTPSCGTGIAAD